MAELSLIFYVLLFVVAFLYAAVGHGGASGYLALMALFNVPTVLLRPSALILNIFVSLMAFYQYFRKGKFNWKLFLMLVVVSMPAAFLGGMVVLDPTIYKRILGVILILPIIRFAGFWPQEEGKKREIKLWLSLLIGAVIGFLSGLIGIGGGIILTPVLLLLAWADMKEAAGISALFITVNSVAGLLGNVMMGMELGQDIVWLVAVALGGGTLGSYFGANYFSGTFLKRMLALVLVIACFKLLFA
ncbi:sulfite exporter TauE/SafE family protein [Nafulsella turpanensis]|uniref:sulfite exporter TauE/SafE family protein n=1 Tax=Nafulsella turpanensis TaxID=1265690 RepID=UPI000345815F|nr:sulfite exporter TauE/SafE family protein [Nafulsella turpanensis]